MKANIASSIDACMACQTNKASLPRPALRHTTPSSAETPMKHIAMDLFDALGKKWIVMVDRFSGYAWLEQLRSTTTANIIDTIQTWFYDYGWPDYIRSDEGPQEFDRFCADNSNNHELSSPYNPESNGLAKSAVKIMKTLVISCKMQKESLTKANAAWRNMTREDSTTPSQLFFGRRQRQVLPMMTDKLTPAKQDTCLLYTSPSPRDLSTSRMPSSA